MREVSGKKKNVLGVKIPQPGFEPGSLRPQLSVLTIKQPEHSPLYSLSLRQPLSQPIGSVKGSPKLMVLQWGQNVSQDGFIHV